MSEVKDTQSKKGVNKKLVIVCIVAAVVIVALVCVILFLLKPNETKKRDVVVTEDNIEDILADQPKPEGIPLSYQVTMNSTWEFEDGQSASRNAYVANSNNNETPVYFDVIRNDTQEVIYQSPVIPLGMDLDDIVLDVDLDAGDYECTVVYHLIDEEQNTLTTVNMWVMVRVEN